MANAAQLRMAKRQKDAVKQNRQGWDSGNDGMGQGNDPDAQPWWNIFLGCCAGGRDDGLVESLPQNTKEMPKKKRKLKRHQKIQIKNLKKQKKKIVKKKRKKKKIVKAEETEEEGGRKMMLMQKKVERKMMLMQKKLVKRMMNKEIYTF